MVSGSRIDSGSGAQIISAGVRKTIQSIKEIVGNHSDADIYVTLKETNMDPNETAQKLLNQDPFHEVKRKRDKKKEVTWYKGSTGIELRQHAGHVGQGDHNVVRRGSYSGSPLHDAGGNREFRVVRANIINQNASTEMRLPSMQSSMPINEPVFSNVSEKSSTGTSSNKKPLVGRHSAQSLNGATDLRRRQARYFNSIGIGRRDRRLSVQNTSDVQALKPNNSQPYSTVLPNNSVAGVYSSSSDPVHVPSPAANVGAIKHEVGVVGVRRWSYESSFKVSSTKQASSFSHSQFGHDRPSSRESFRSFSNNQYSSRSHQQLLSHQKAPHPNKEWKPKSTQKPSVVGPQVLEAVEKSVSPSANSHKDLKTEAAQLQDKLSRVNLSENQNVIIAAHIRVSETERSRLTFGSLGTEFEPSWSTELQAAKESFIDHSASLSISPPESLSDESSGSMRVDSIDERVQNSGSNSPASGALSEHQLVDRKESSSPQNFDNYADIRLLQNSPSYTPSQAQQQRDPAELPSFSAFDPQTGYDIPYFRQTVDETVTGQGVPSPQEAIGNSIPASAIAMVQQQQQQVQQMAQMYPQVHVPHFSNLMPYRQFLSPVYVPPMPVPGYSSNPAAYTHPSNGSSYVLMAGGNSHLTANGIKYGIQQFKPVVPSGSPTGFASFANPTGGYAINAPPGVVGSATGLEDSSRLKYKDGNLYVPNPQAETSEIWMNPRDMQSGSYYNMQQGQTPPHAAAAAAYMPSSHIGHHPSFNAHSAHMQQHQQFPGLYHNPPQPASIPNPNHHHHHLGGNVGVGVAAAAAAAPGPQLGAYQQQSQLGLSWTGNF